MSFYLVLHFDYRKIWDIFFFWFTELIKIDKGIDHQASEVTARDVTHRSKTFFFIL